MGRFRLQRNADVSEVPSSARAVEFRYSDSPEENGDSVRYGDFKNGKADEGEPQWYEIDHAGGSDYSGGTVSKANYDSLEAMLEEKHPRGQKPVVWAEAHGGHGTFALLVVWDRLDRDIQEAIGSLEDYPVLDEHKLSEIETELENDAWRDWVQSDFEKKFLKAWNAELELDPDDELEDWPEDFDSYTAFHLGEELTNTYWEHGESSELGSGPSIDIERIVDGLVDYFAGHKPFPDWAQKGTTAEDVREMAKAFDVELVRRERQRENRRAHR